jgi:hypothetical protein
MHMVDPTVREANALAASSQRIAQRAFIAAIETHRRCEAIRKQIAGDLELAARLREANENNGIIRGQG